MSKKKVHHEEHVDETWLIPYADMLTLLLALFIVMFAMSQLDKAKLEVMSQQFSAIFSAGGGVMSGAGDTVMPIQVPDMPADYKAIEADKMNELRNSLDEEIKRDGYGDKVKVTLNRDGLEVSIQDVILFKSGDANVIENVSPLLSKISSMLYDLDNDIKIVGHTDNVPIRSGKFRSNWDLSAMRAINVMNFMVEKGDLKPERFSIQAYAEYMPKYDNSTEEGRAKNRRVEIFIVRKYPLESDKAEISVSK